MTTAKKNTFEGDSFTFASEKYEIGDVGNSSVLIVNKEPIGGNNITIGSKRDKGFPLEPGESIVIRSSNPTIPLFAIAGTLCKYLVVTGKDTEIVI